MILFESGGVVALLLLEGEVICAHAGDSRLYVLHGAELVQLTRDHSRVREMIDGYLGRTRK